MNKLPQVQRLIGGVVMMVSLCPPGVAQGALPFSVDPIDADRLALSSLFNLHDRNLRGEPCEDDCEVTTGSILDPIEDEGEGNNGCEIMGFASQPKRVRGRAA